jgi:hypothetical protein
MHGDEVVWVVGLRRGAAAPVTGDTREVTCLEVAGGPCESNQLLEALGEGAC